MRLCCVDNCNNPVAKTGLCNAHYLRKYRHGDVNYRERAANNEVLAWIRETALPFKGSECLTWPYATLDTGYGSAIFEGRNQSAHRVVCKLFYGPPPTRWHYAAHECGNGHLGCINPLHLKWKTPKENSADKLRHGTHNRGEQGTAKLTEIQVKEIRSLAGKMLQREIAEKYGVTRMTISAIITRQNWSWLP